MYSVEGAKISSTQKFMTFVETHLLSKNLWSFLGQPSSGKANSGRQTCHSKEHFFTFKLHLWFKHQGKSMSFWTKLLLLISTLELSLGQVFITETFVTIYTKKNFQPFVNSTAELRDFLSQLLEVEKRLSNDSKFIMIEEKAKICRETAKKLKIA